MTNERIAMQMSEGKRVVIVLPDERRMEVVVQPNLLSSDLLDLVASQVALKEKEFFALAFLDDTYVPFIFTLFFPFFFYLFSQQI